MNLDDLSDILAAVGADELCNALQNALHARRMYIGEKKINGPMVGELKARMTQECDRLRAVMLNINVEE